MREFPSKMRMQRRFEVTGGDQKRRYVSALLFAGMAIAYLSSATLAIADSEAPTGTGKGFAIKVIVANLTSEKAGIDDAAKRLHKELKNQFRYEGIKVLESEKLKFADDEVFDMKLPSRRRLRIRPLVVESDSALISVEISGLVQSDLRLKRGQLVIIGAERYQRGKLVIALEADN
ncbi:MAG: hypothetical protein ACI8W3_003823 [Myxococcota bacterium]